MTQKLGCAKGTLAGAVETVGKEAFVFYMRFFFKKRHNTMLLCIIAADLQKAVKDGRAHAACKDHKQR